MKIGATRSNQKRKRGLEIRSEERTKQETQQDRGPAIPQRSIHLRFPSNVSQSLATLPLLCCSLTSGLEGSECSLYWGWNPRVRAIWIRFNGNMSSAQRGPIGTLVLNEPTNGIQTCRWNDRSRSFPISRPRILS